MLCIISFVIKTSCKKYSQNSQYIIGKLYLNYIICIAEIRCIMGLTCDTVPVQMQNGPYYSYSLNIYKVVGEDFHFLVRVN